VSSPILPRALIYCGECARLKRGRPKMADVYEAPAGQLWLVMNQYIADAMVPLDGSPVIWGPDYATKLSRVSPNSLADLEALAGKNMSLIIDERSGIIHARCPRCETKGASRRRMFDRAFIASHLVPDRFVYIPSTALENGDELVKNLFPFNR
jgi:hypothetical protein